MKTLAIVATSLLITAITFGQNQTVVENPKFQNEQYKSINHYLSTYIDFPDYLKQYDTEGTVVVQFNVTPKGNITDYKVINSVAPQIDAYVKKALESTDGEWTPGIVNGNPTTSKKEVSVAFLLHSPKMIVEQVEIYQRKGNRWLFEKNNPEKALKYYNRGIALIPYEEGLLAMRSLCKYETGNLTGAITDWNRLQELAKRNNSASEIDKLAVSSENVDEFITIIKSKSELR